MGQEATSKWWLGVLFANARDMIQANPDAFAPQGITSLKDLAIHVGIDPKRAYQLAKDADLLGETAYRATERAGLRRAEYRALRGLSEGRLAEIRKLAENSADRPPDEVREAIDALLVDYGAQVKRGDEAERRENAAKVREAKQKDLAHASLVELNKLRKEDSLNRAAVNDFPVTTLAQETSAYVAKAVSLMSALKRRTYNEKDRLILRRLGVRAMQVGNMVMDTFTEAMGGLDGLAKPMVLMHKDAAGNWVPDEDEDGNWIPANVTEPPEMGNDLEFRERPKRCRPTPPRGKTPEEEFENVMGRPPQPGELSRSPKPDDPVEQTADGDESNV
jgi:hypothetical protein